MSLVLVRGDLKIHVVEGRGFKNADKGFFPLIRDTSDPFCEVRIAGNVLMISRTHCNSKDPIWDAKAEVPLCYPDDKLFFIVNDDDFTGKQNNGEATLTLQPTDESWTKVEWLKLNEKGEILVEISFVPFSAPEEILKTEPVGYDHFYFSPHDGGGLRLYQDAHNETIKELSEKESRNLFVDIIDAFEKAKRFIYISGWSVWTDLMMRRDQDKRILGNVLKRKADEGVRVLVLIWNEKYSAKLCNSLFGTHDSQTINFFQGSNVTGVAARRVSEKCNLKQNLKETVFTHHIKSIVVDDPVTGLVGFIGGIDLTDGRWDTPDHPHWKTLNTTHKGDFYNGFYPKLSEKSGPREPYHDCHARIEGYAAVDLLRVFEERWTKQASKFVQRLVPFPDEELIKYIPYNPKKTRKFHMQILRSIDSDSSLFKPRKEGLTSYGYKVKDCSVHHGLV